MQPRARVHLLEWRCHPGGFFNDGRNRKTTAWRTVAIAGVSASAVHSMLLEAIDKRIGTYRTLDLTEVFSDYGGTCTARATPPARLEVVFHALGQPTIKPHSEVVVKMFKRDYVSVNQLPDAKTDLRLIKD